jgi:hypothetical protein
MLASLLILLGTAHARCPTTMTYTVEGATDRGIEALCVFLGTVGTCVPSEGGPYSVPVEVPVQTRGGLFGDRCSVDLDVATVTTRGAEGARLRVHRIRNRALTWRDEGPVISLHPRK